MQWRNKINSLKRTAQECWQCFRTMLTFWPQTKDAYHVSNYSGCLCQFSPNKHHLIRVAMTQINISTCRSSIPPSSHLSLFTQGVRLFCFVVGAAIRPLNFVFVAIRRGVSVFRAPQKGTFTNTEIDLIIPNKATENFLLTMTTKAPAEKRRSWPPKRIAHFYMECCCQCFLQVCLQPLCCHGNRRKGMGTNRSWLAKVTEYDSIEFLIF